MLPSLNSIFAYIINTNQSDQIIVNVAQFSSYFSILIEKSASNLGLRVFVLRIFFLARSLYLLSANSNHIQHLRLFIKPHLICKIFSERGDQIKIHYPTISF